MKVCASLWAAKLHIVSMPVISITAASRKESQRFMVVLLSGV